jgi:hypothetical protein
VAGVLESRSQRGRSAAKNTIRPSSAGRRTVDSGRPRRCRPIDLDAFVAANLGALVIGLVVGFIALVVVAVVLARRLTEQTRRLDGLTRGSDERSLEGILESHLGRVHQVVRDVEKVAARTAILERDSKRAFARVGLVRYNPFEDTGGNQSFALALIDAKGDGFIVSSLHSRNATRLYAKSLSGGRSEVALSTEEAEALKLAMAQSPAGSLL